MENWKVKKKKLFYNRDILVEKLKDSSIHYVREMYRGKIKDQGQLLKMIEEKSIYTDGRVEGIYLKIFLEKLSKKDLFLKFMEIITIQKMDLV